MENQRESWDIIAEDWNKFRREPFPNSVLKLAKIWQPGTILDLGCGNGRNLVPFSKREFDCYGVDFSEEMIKNAKKNFKDYGLKAEFKIGELTKIPFGDKIFNYAICVAALHHLNKYDQVICLKEIRRVLKDNGRLYISVWNKWQRNFIFSGKETFISWKTKNNLVKRYYYLFDIFELKKLLEKHGFKITRGFGTFSKNIEMICRKI